MSDTVTMLIELTEKLFADTARLEARVKELEELLNTQNELLEWMMMAKRLLKQVYENGNPVFLDFNETDWEELETLLETEGGSDE